MNQKRKNIQLSNHSETHRKPKDTCFSGYASHTRDLIISLWSSWGLQFNMKRNRDPLSRNWQDKGMKRNHSSLKSIFLEAAQDRYQIQRRGVWGVKKHESQLWHHIVWKLLRRKFVLDKIIEARGIVVHGLALRHGHRAQRADDKGELKYRM